MDQLKTFAVTYRHTHVYETTVDVQATDAEAAKDALFEDEDFDPTEGFLTCSEGQVITVEEASR